MPAFCCCHWAPSPPAAWFYSTERRIWKYPGQVNTFSARLSARSSCCACLGPFPGIVHQVPQAPKCLTFRVCRCCPLTPWVAFSHALSLPPRGPQGSDFSSMGQITLASNLAFEIQQPTVGQELRGGLTKWPITSGGGPMRWLCLALIPGLRCLAGSGFSSIQAHLAELPLA